jgi:O-antigen ligase
VAPASPPEPVRRGLLGRRRPLTLLLLGGAAVLGFGAGYAPLVLLAGIAAIGLVALILADLAVGLVAFAVIQFFAMVPFFGGQELTVVKGTGALLALSWAIVIFRTKVRPGDPGLAERADRSTGPRSLLAGFPVIVLMLLLFLTWSGLSYLWSIEPDRVLQDLQRYALNFVLYAIVATAISAPRHAQWIAGAIVAGTALAACSGSFFTPTNDPDRLEGAIGDPNDLAAALVPGIILAVALVCSVRSPWWRLLALAAAGIGLYAMLLTGSRGGLIGFGAALLMLFVVGTRWRKQLAALLAACGGAAVLYYVLAAPKDLADRVTEAGDGSGRLDIWLLGWRVFEDRPFLGAGLGNFIVATPLYLVEPGLVSRADRILTTPKIAHNMYLSMLTELGMVGFVLFMGIVLTSLALMIRATQLFMRSSIPGMSLLCTAFTAGLTGLLVADFFLSGQHEKHLWLLLGMGPALLLMARREAATRISPVVPRDRPSHGSTSDHIAPPVTPLPEPARQGRPRA